MNTVSRRIEAVKNLDLSAIAGSGRMQFGALFAIFALLTIAAYFSPHIWQHGEAREALVIRDIVRHDHWLLPLRNGELPSKPVLYHWIGASLAVVLGYSDLVVRLPSVLAAALLAWLTYSLGTLGTERKTALLAVGILASTFEFWVAGTEARVDMLFASLTGAALASWYVWYRSGGELARGVAYLAGALAVLAKGPAGAVLPALVIVAFLTWKRELRILSKFFSWRWTLVVLGFDLGWYWAAYQRGGVDFLQKQIVYENVERFLGSAEFPRERNSFSQVFWLLRALFPWSLVLILAPIRWLCGKRENSFGHFLHAWWLTIFGFFSLAAGYRAVYLLPIYSAVSLLAARECACLLDGWQKLRGDRRLGERGWMAASVFVTVFSFVLAVAIPIVRTAREDNNDQEAFVENILPKISRATAIYAAPDFPKTTLWVLAYRLNRSIAWRTLQCRGDYYYLSRRSRDDSCSPGVVSTVASIANGGPRLLHVSYADNSTSASAQ